MPSRHKVPKHALLDLSRPVTVGQCLDAYAAERRRAGVKDGTVRVTLSAATRAFGLATGMEGNALRAATANGLLRDLPLFAGEAHQHTDDGGVDARARVQRFADKVAGIKLGSTRVAFPELLLDPMYWPLLPYLHDADAVRFLTHFPRLVRRGRGTPTHLPSLGALDRARLDLGLSQLVAGKAENSYRRARAGLLAVDPTAAERFGELPERASGMTSGLSRLLGDAGADVWTETKRILPKLAKQADAYCAKGVTKKGGDHISESWQATVRQIVSLLAAWMIEETAPELVDDPGALDFIERTRPVVVIRAGADGEGADDPFADAGEGSYTIEVPLIEAIIDAAAPALVAGSKYRDDILASASARYTDRMLQVVTVLQGIITHGYKARLANEPTRWARIDARLAEVQAKVSAGLLARKDRTKAKDKRRLLRALTYPMVLCLIIPMLRRRALAAKAAYEAASADAIAHGHTNRHPAVRKLRTAWKDTLLDYLVVALPIDDGLREKNYRRGRLGVHFHLRKHGTEVWTLWSRRRTDEASRKDRVSKKKVPLRERRLRPGIVDPALLWDYVREFRPEALVAARELKSVAEYDLAADLSTGKWALLVSPDPRTTRADRSYGKGWLSERYGRVLNRAAREWIGADVPEFHACGPEWTGLWAVHTSRLLLATYWGGVRGQWDRATELTDDKRKTLEDEYVEVDSLVTELLGGAQGWEHPRAYDRWMDALVDGFTTRDPLDDPDLPLPPKLAAVLKAERQAAEPVAKRNRRHQGPRFREARPGQRVRPAA